MKKEQDTQGAIIKRIEAMGGWVAKVITASRSGVPDLLVCLDGKFYGIEVKSETGTVEPLQQYNLDKITKAGGVAIVARSVADVMEAIKKPTKT
jgi:hypothetical protein